MKKTVLILFALIVGLLVSGCSQTGPVQVHLLQVSSLRGALFPVEVDGVLQGGIGLVAGAVDDIRSTYAGEQVINLATYNMTYGTPESFVTDGMAIIDIMNDIGFDGMVIGPREFYFGFSVLEAHAQRANFPFLAANLAYEDGSPIPFLQGSFLHAGSKIGIIGLAPPTTLEQNMPEHVQGITLLDPRESVDREVAKLRSAGAAEILLIAGGFGFFDFENTSEEFLRLIDNPDVDMTVLSVAPGREAGHYTLAGSGKRVLALDGNIGAGGRAIDYFNWTSPGFRSIPVTSETHRPPDRLEKSLGDVYTFVQNLLSMAISHAPVEVLHDFNQESALGNLFTDLLREHFQADVLMINSGGIRGGFQKGPIRIHDVYVSYPFGGNLVFFLADRSQIVTILEQSLTYIGRPERGRGFMQVSGLEFAYTEHNGSFKLLEESIKIGSETLSDKQYLVGVERFPFMGGDGYTAFRGIEPEQVIARSTLSLLIELIQNRDSVQAGVDGRMKLVSSGGNGQ